MPPQSLPNKSPTKLGSDAVSAFLILLRDGINSWQTAGALLVKLRKDNPSVYAEIIRREPLITVDMLETIERIGQKKLHPQLLLNSQFPAKLLIGFPYDEQARLCSEPIDVVVSVRDGKPTVAKRIVRDCSRWELSVALDTSRVRTVEEQKKFYQPKTNEGNPAWREISRLPKPNPARPLVVQNAPQISPGPAQRPPPTENLVCIGRWVVRKGIGNNCGFERVSAAALDPIKVILEDNVATIEVFRRKTDEK